MFKRITSFSLALCLIIGMSTFPISNTAVYADDAFSETTSIDQEVLSPGGDSALTDTDKAVYTDDAFSEAANIEQATSPGDDYTFTDTDVYDDFELPNTSSKVDMTSGRQAPQTLGLFTAMAEQRYTVLVLDTSSSMPFEYNGKVFYTAYTAVEYVKAAAKKLIEGLQSANGTNHVAIVQYKGASATVVSPFSTDLPALSSAIDGLYASQGTRNVAAGLRAANTLISDISDSSAIKNVVLFTTGVTNDGPYSYSGHYGQNTVGSDWRRVDTQIRLYAYANTAYAEAESLKNNATLYTIGLFQTMEDMPASGSEVVQFFKLSALELATSPRYFYDVKDPDDLEFVFGEIAESIVKKSGTFKYPGEGRDNSAVYYYDDAYFYESSYIYNKHLATMSLCLELSVWGSEDVGNSYSLKMVNAQNLLDETGFTDFDHNYMDFSYNGVGGKPTKDSIGAVAANKSIIANGKDYTLIAVAVRGGGYESEWASNFTIGESGQHTGFSEARDQVIGFLDRYIRNNGITGDIKLWITGYSRAAATANMVAGKIDDGVSFQNCNLALKDLYAYTFETPAGAQKSDVTYPVMTYVEDTNGDGVIDMKDKGVLMDARLDKYNNIFNIINPNDPVPKVAPAYWSFVRYGVDRHLPSALTLSESEYFEIKNDMLDQYEALGSNRNAYSVDFFKMKKINIDAVKFLPGGDPLVSVVDDEKNAQSQSAFLDSYITMFTKDFLKNRSNYVSRFQGGVRDFCGIFFGAEPSKIAKLMEIAPKKIVDNGVGIIGTFLWNGEGAAYLEIARHLRESLDEAGITDYNQAAFDIAVVNIPPLVLGLASNHPNLATTLYLNINGIGQAHFPDLCLAWMMSQDSYYTSPGKAEAEGFTSGKYRIVRINCPVDVNVYNVAEQLVASIINDVPQNISSIISAINEDGEKVIFLPASDSYSVEIIATGDDLMTYSLNEYNPQAGEVNRLVNYYDIPITNGQKFIGDVPAYDSHELDDINETASTSIYTLATGEDEIEPSDELSGEAAKSAYFIVNAVSSNASLGIVSGSGTRQLGTFAQVEAIPYADSKFLGWYENSTTLVANEPVYRFRVSKDTNLTAKFESTKPISNDSGSSSSGGSSYTPSSTTAVTPEPESTATPKPWANPFTDVNISDWFYNDAEFVVTHNLFVGTSATTFSPQVPMTRGMLVTVLYRLAGKPAVGGGVNFSDTVEDAWYAEAVAWAKETGVVNGVGGNRFAPDSSITREQTATILLNYATHAGFAQQGDQGAAFDFADVDKISAWAMGGARYCYASGIITGKPGKLFDPQGQATRAEVAAILHRFADNTPE